MKINNNIPNYLKLPHIGHPWKFLKNVEPITFTNVSHEHSTKNNSLTYINPNKTLCDQSPQKKLNRLSQSISLDVVESVKDSNKRRVKQLADELIKKYDNLKQIVQQQKEESKPKLFKNQSLTQIEVKKKDDLEINSFAQFFQLVKSQQQDKAHKRKCQSNFFKKSSSMDQLNKIEQQKKITQLILKQKIRIKPKQFSSTINIQDLLQQN